MSSFIAFLFVLNTLEIVFIMLDKKLEKLFLNKLKNCIIINSIKNIDFYREICYYYNIKGQEVRNLQPTDQKWQLDDLREIINVLISLFFLRREKNELTRTRILYY